MTGLSSAKGVKGEYSSFDLDLDFDLSFPGGGLDWDFFVLL